MDERVRGDVRDQVVPRERSPGRVVDEERVGGAVPGSQRRAQAPPARLDDIAVGEPHVEGRSRSAVAPAIAGDREERVTCLGRRAVEEQQALLPVLLGDQRGLDVRDVVREQLVPGDPAARAFADRGGEPDVVGVLVGEDQQLDVLDPEAVAREPRLERGERLRCVRPGVDERERVTPEEPAVDGADGERRREDERLHRQAGGATTIAGSAAKAKDGAARASSSARARSSSHRLSTLGPPPAQGSRSTSSMSASAPGIASAPNASTRYLPRPTGLPGSPTNRPIQAVARSRKVASSGITLSR